ncbi:hypothetical protein, partial [Vibrio jasicida]|uniref:hypothetical protein n=1 Tax=Vibrio jasicida TaxID=766224 RepID=UPI00390B30F6
TTENILNSFSINDLWALLKSQSCFIYHGIAEAPGVGNPHVKNIPVEQRLLDAFYNRHNWAVCCSTITVGDSELKLDYWGFFGLIVKPTNPDSIILAHHQDAGSIPDPKDPRKRIVSGCFTPDISILELESTIKNRNGANEWGVSGFEVAAIYIEYPVSVSALQWVRTNFSDILILTQYQGSFVSIDESSGAIKYGSVVTPADIYK